MVEGRLRELVERAVESCAEIAREAGDAERRRIVERLTSFLCALRKTGTELNLVSQRFLDPELLVDAHLVDALSGLEHLPRRGRTRLLDIGTGAGFPAVPLLIARPELQGVLVESVGKKARFLQTTLRELELTAQVVACRFPAPSDNADAKQTFSRGFDVLTTRGVAAAGSLVQRARPILREGARALAWTTAELFPEIAATSGAARSAFHRDSRSRHRGIAVLECFT